MDLLASRLKNITSKTRHAISPTMTGIIEHICNMMTSSQEVSNFSAVLNALRAAAETTNSLEIPALTKTLPLMITAAVNQKRYTADVLECILPIRYCMPSLKDLILIWIIGQYKAWPPDIAFLPRSR